MMHESGTKFCRGLAQSTEHFKRGLKLLLSIMMITKLKRGLKILTIGVSLCQIDWHCGKPSEGVKQTVKTRKCIFYY